MLPQNNVKIQGFAGAFWSGFGTSELRVQLTSAHTCTLTARASRIVSRSLRQGGRDKKECVSFIRATPFSAGVSNTSILWGCILVDGRRSYNWRKDRLAINSGGHCPVPKVSRGLQPPQPPPPVFLCHTVGSTM